MQKKEDALLRPLFYIAQSNHFLLRLTLFW